VSIARSLPEELNSYKLLPYLQHETRLKGLEGTNSLAYFALARKLKKFILLLEHGLLIHDRNKLGCLLLSNICGQGFEPILKVETHKGRA